MTTTQTIPYASDLQRQQDDSHLNALVICHYIWGGLLALFALFPIFHVGMGIWMLNEDFSNAQGGPPPAFIAWMFIIMGSAFILFGEVIAALTIYSAVQISRRKRRMFSIVIAGINCFFMPLGTVLGVFTILVLVRESVRRQYEEARQLLAEEPVHQAWAARGP